MQVPTVQLYRNTEHLASTATNNPPAMSGIPRREDIKVRKITIHQTLATALLLSASPLAWSPAVAQAAAEAPAASNEDIVVTARKTTERLQDVPIAVTALSGKALEARGIASVTDLQQVAPNLQFTPGQGGNSGAIDEALRCKETGEAKTILFNLTGHGHFDMASYDRYLAGELGDFEYPEEAIKASLQHLPKVG